MLDQLLSLARGRGRANDIDYEAGASVFVAARLAVIAFSSVIVLWTNGPAAKWLAGVILGGVGIHAAWWWYYLHGRRRVTLPVAFTAALGDVILVGVACMFSGGLASPAAIVWTVTISMSGTWIGLRWTLPLIGVIGLFAAGMASGVLSTGIAMTLSPAQLAVWVTGILLLLSFHVAMGSRMQRQHSRALADAEMRARHDPLTGLANRRVLAERLEEELAVARDVGTALTLAIVDLDDFKAINDTHGHIAGDDVLVSLADEIRGSVRSADLPVRLGGEEFVILMPDTDADTASAVLVRLRASLATSRRASGVTFSAGVAELTPEIVDGNQLIAIADEALYRAKRSGKDRTMVGDATMLGSVERAGVRGGVMAAG